MAERRADFNPSPEAGQVRRQEVEFPKDPEKRMGALLAAIGNSESKAMTLLLMQPGVVYPRYELHRAFMTAQGQSPEWRTSRLLQFNYCKDSLEPIGLVAKEIINPDLSTYGYEITDFGREVGVPLAGLLLDFSNRHDISLQDIFGATTSTSPGLPEEKKRAPATRLKILRELVKAKGLFFRAADIVKAIGLDSRASSRGAVEQIVQLQRKGIINYTSREASRPFAIYYLNQQHPPVLPQVDGRQPLFTQRICEFVEKHADKKLTRGKWTELFIQENPEYYGQRSLVGSVNRALSFLANNGYFLIEKFKGKVQSEVSLTEEQRRVIVELLAILDGFKQKDQGILMRGRHLAFYFLAHPEDVARLMRRAREHSPLAQRDQDIVLDYLLMIVQEFPRFNSREIRAMLQSRYERSLTQDAVLRYLERLQKEGKLKMTQQKKGEGYRWILSSIEEETDKTVEPDKKIEGLSQRTDQIEFSSSLKGRLNAIFSAFNTGPNAVTFLLLPLDRQTITLEDLYQKFGRIFGGTSLSSVSRHRSRNICEISFSPVGLIAKHFVTNPLGYEKYSGFQIADVGIRYGIPAAALALDFEMRHKISLHEVFGSAHKIPGKEVSGAYHRAAILNALAQKLPGISPKDLRNDLNLDQSFLWLYLKGLNKAGLVSASGSTSRRNVRITDKGMAVVREYLDPIRQLLSDDEELSQRLSADIVPSVVGNLGAFARNSADLYYPHSQSFKVMKGFKQ